MSGTLANIRLYGEDQYYREVKIPYEVLAEASMIIYCGRYFHFWCLDQSPGRAIGTAVFKEGKPPIDITPYLEEPHE